MVGKGQPPKKTEDKRCDKIVGFSPKEEELVNKSREKEAPEKKFGTYVRDTMVKHAKEILNEDTK